MKKILFCNIPMTLKTSKCIYESDDFSIPVSKRSVNYPVSAFLEKTLTSEDEIKAVLIVKKDKLEHYKKNISLCIEELMIVTKVCGAKFEYTVIDTEFIEDEEIHNNLLISIIDQFEEKAHIIADITYGPKDVPIVLFTAMNFGEKFLNCEIDNIVYGQATFINGNITNTKICDMVPLYYLNLITNTIECNDPIKAKQMLKSILSI